MSQKNRGKGTQKRSDQTAGSQRNAQRGVQKYGVICRNAEAHVLKKMGVPDNNVVGVNAMNAVLNRMVAGDALCVPTISSFACGAYDFFCKLQFLSSRGLEFQSGNESYLNFSSIKPLSVATVETLKNFATREVGLVNVIKTLELQDEVKYALSERICKESLTDLVIVFSNNGIRKRGN